MTIERTTYGIPHITANDPESLAYGVAYAYAQDNVCMTADQLVTARGQRSSTFGAQTIGLLGRRCIPSAQISLCMPAPHGRRHAGARLGPDQCINAGPGARLCGGLQPVSGRQRRHAARGRLRGLMDIDTARIYLNRSR